MFVQEAKSLMFEGGSDVFTSNRHQLHNNEAKIFNLMTFRTQDDAPFFTSSHQQHQQYVSATIPVEKDGCERVTSLMKRSNFQVLFLLLSSLKLDKKWNSKDWRMRISFIFSGSNMLRLWQWLDCLFLMLLIIIKLEKSHP